MTIAQERLSPEEYVAFLKRTDLGSQYPKERFALRIRQLLASVPISLVARDDAGAIVGTLFGLTDFASWLFITDLGVARDCQRQGIGRALMKTAHEIAGGEKDVAVYLCANTGAVPFYERLGMKKSEDVMEYKCVDWTKFTVK